MKKRPPKIQYGRSYKYKSTEQAIKDLLKVQKKQMGAKGLAKCGRCGSVHPKEKIVECAGCPLDVCPSCVSPESPGHHAGCWPGESNGVGVSYVE